jgi:TolB protein
MSMKLPWLARVALLLPFFQCVVPDDPAAVEPIADPGIIAFYSERDGNAELYSMRPDGTQLTRLTHTQEDEHCPDISPDGRQVAYSLQGASTSRLYIMDIDGSHARRVIESQVDDTHPEWSPDGQRIAYMSLLDGKGEICIVDVDGGGSTD